MSSGKKDRQAQIIESQNQYIQELRERNGQLVRLTSLLFFHTPTHSPARPRRRR